jgi:acyl carrier protein
MFSEKELKLAKFFVEREGDGVLDSLKNCNLVDKGFLDSLDMVVLAVFIEKEFNVKIDIASEDIYSKMQSFDEIFKMIDA